MLSNCQFGFRPGYSTETAILSIVNSWFFFIGSQKSSLCSLLQSHKSIWLCPSQAPILNSSSSLYLPLLLLYWLHSYLQGYTQQIIIGGSLSSKSQVTSGVLQGSILGPLLFIIYINDITKVTSPLYSHPHLLCQWHSSISRNFFSNFNVYCSIQHQSHYIMD